MTPSDQLFATVESPFNETGTVKRALIPFSSNKRMATRSYNGLAAVQTSRFVCVPVDMDAQLTTKIELPPHITSQPLTWGENPGSQSRQIFLNRTALNASISWSYVLSNNFNYDLLALKSKQGSGDVHIRCAADGTCRGVPVFCYLPDPGIREAGSPLEGIDKSIVGFCFFSNVPFLAPFLVLQMPRQTDDWTAIFSREYLVPQQYMGIPLRKIFVGGPWSEFSAPALQGNDILATVCAGNLSWNVEDVIMQSPVDLQEPSLMWSEKNKTWNTESVLKLLGSASHSFNHRERSVLTLASSESVTSWKPVLDSAFPWLYDSLFDGLVPSAGYGSEGTNTNFNSTIHFCSSCKYDSLPPSVLTDPYHNILLQSALEATNDPAKALESLITSLFLSMYYSGLEAFNFGNTSTIIWSTPVLIPTRWKGFIIVVSLLAVTYTCLITLLVIYLRGTQYSMLGSSWYAVAQLQSLDLRPFLRSASKMTDREFDTILKKEELTDVEAALAATTDGDVELVRRERKGKRKNSEDSD